MPYFSNNDTDFLGSLESYLYQNPAEGYEELKEIPSRLTELLDSKEADSEANMEMAVQLLGTAVGKQREWQSPFREAGTLRHVLNHLDPATNPTGLAKQYLRVIGNCVADNDENRRVVTPYFGKPVAFMDREELIATAVAVMLNLCNEFDPAQVQATNSRLESKLAKYLSLNLIPGEAIDHAVDLLTWTTEKLTPIQIKDWTSVRTFQHLIKACLEYDEDHYHDYVALCVHYLQDPEFQQKVATLELVEGLVDLLLDYEARLSYTEIQGVLHALGEQQDPAKTTTEDINILLLVQLVNAVSSISATDAFVKNLNTSSPVVKKIKSRLLHSGMFPSAVCASIMLGNLATSDQVSIDMVEDMGILPTLIDILSSTSEPALLYAAAGLMRHLAFPEENRTVLGRAGLIETCCGLLINKDPSVRGEAAAILGKLVSNNLQNIKEVVYNTIPDGFSPTELPDVQVPDHPTILYHIVTQALVASAPIPSTSMKNAMIELGRTIVAILRYLGRSHDQEDMESLIQHMFKTPLVARPIARLVRQRFFAEARSEGLLGLGLMARLPNGAACVIEEMEADSGLFEAVKEIATSQKTESQQGQLHASRDLQNAVVLLHGLVEQGVHAIDAALGDQVASLQAELSKLTTS